MNPNRFLTTMMIAVGYTSLMSTPAQSTQSSSMTPDELLDRAIAYHDPSGVWQEPHELRLEEKRPNGVIRHTRIVLNQRRAAMEMEREVLDEETKQKVALWMSVVGERVDSKLNGSRDVSEDDAKRYRLGPDQGRSTRNYYAYLYGLPMKLKDPGTKLHAPVREAEFDGQEAIELKVTYAEGVGSDTWYFYFHPERFALIGYRFYHDESKNDGEYITLAGEMKSPDGMRLPQVRTWYTHGDDRLLGTDSIVSLAPLR